MEPNIQVHFRDCIKKYNKICEKNKEIYSRPFVNDINTMFFIIQEMYKKYGCVECSGFDCSCDCMPKKHNVVADRICEGQPDWE